MDVAFSRFVSQFKEETNIQDRIAPLLLAFFSGLALYALTAVWPVDTHDGITHIRRIEALTGALREGVIYPRWFPDHMFGYGTPVLNYYSPGFYYPPALIHAFGFDSILSIRIALSLGFGISAWWMYQLSRLFVTVWPAMVSVICFQFFPYRIYDFFIRGAFPEFSAFVWLPLIAFCTLKIVRLDRKASNGASISLTMVVAGLAWAGLIVTHNLTALMGVLLLGALLMVFIVFQHKEISSVFRIIVISTSPVAIGIVLTAWYVLPALLELGWVMNGNRLFTGIGMSHFLSWGELVDLEIFYSYSFPRNRPRLPVYIIPIGLAALAAALTTRSRKMRILTQVAIPMTLGIGWVMTDTSSWLWTRSALFFDQVQFPWRWQIFAAPGAALLLAASIESMRRKGRSWETLVPLLSLVISAYLVAYATLALNYTTNEDSPDVSHWSRSWEDFFWNSSISIMAQHLLPIWSVVPMVEAADTGLKPWDVPPVSDPIQSVSVTPTQIGLLQQEYQITTDETFRLLFHQFYFPPWRVFMDGIEVEAEPASALGLASVVVPPGAHTVEISWGTTIAVWLGRSVTAAGWVVVITLLINARIGSAFLGRRRGVFLTSVREVGFPVAWLAVGAFMLLAASGITARSWDFSAIGADYGVVRLEGIRSIPPQRAGGGSSCTLDMACQRPWRAVASICAPG